MTGREIANLGSALLTLACTVQKLGNKRYASSAAWKDFPAQVGILQGKHMKLTTQLESYGKDIGPALQEAETVLQKEVQILEKELGREEKNHCGNVCGTSSLARRRTKFPEEIRLAVGNAIRAYDIIERKLRTQQGTEGTEENSTVVTSMPPMLYSLCYDRNFMYAFYDDESMKDENLDSPMLLEDLVAIMRTSQKPALVFEAITAIVALAGDGADKATRDQIANSPGLLDDLKSYLDRSRDHPRLIWEFDVIYPIARILANVAPTGKALRLVQILAPPLEERRQQVPGKKLASAQGIRNLARWDNDEIKGQILGFPRLLGNLARLLDDDMNDGQLQKYASEALLHLSSSGDKSIKAKLLRSPALMKRLSTSLGTTQNPVLQCNAVSLLANLSDGGAHIIQETVNLASLMDKLAKLLDHENSKCREKSAALAVLSNLKQQQSVESDA